MHSDKLMKERERGINMNNKQGILEKRRKERRRVIH